MQQEPSTYKIGGGAPCHYHQLAQKYKPYKPYVAIFDTCIDYRLSKERHYELQHTTQCQPRNYLGEILPILPYVAIQEAE